jgi:hypothetical protein
MTVEVALILFLLVVALLLIVSIGGGNEIIRPKSYGTGNEDPLELCVDYVSCIT